jgi:hypothetical protein
MKILYVIFVLTSIVLGFGVNYQNQGVIVSAICIMAISIITMFVRYLDSGPSFLDVDREFQRHRLK